MPCCLCMYDHTCACFLVQGYMCGSKGLSKEGDCCITAHTASMKRFNRCCQKFPNRGCTNLISHQKCLNDSVVPSLLIFRIVQMFSPHILVGAYSNSIIVSFCMFWVTDDIEHFLTCLWTILAVPLSLLPLSNGVVCLPVGILYIF